MGSRPRGREIDLIVCTPRVIHLVEVKNWSGRLGVRNGVWRQTRRGGDVVDHGDLIRENRLRRDAVAEYLNDRGLDLDEGFVRDHFVPEIFFTNPRLELEPEVEARPDVFSRRELDGYLGKQGRTGLAERVSRSLIGFCLNVESRLGGAAHGRREPIPAARYERIVAFLSETSTWDRLHFHGGRVITGDVVGLRVGTRTYGKPDLVEISGNLPIRFRWTRGWFLGLLKVVTGLGSLGSLRLGKSRSELTTADTVTFHAVGDREPSVVRLIGLERIVLG